MNIILGSGSRFRKGLMERAGYSFSVLVPELDERSIRTEDPYALPLALAKAKAAALLPKITEPSLLVTSDTIVIAGGKIYEKPLSADEFRGFLKEYVSLGVADVITAVVVTNTATMHTESAADICKVAFDPMPADAVEEFIRIGDPYSRAGGFSIEDQILAPYIHMTKGTVASFMGMPLQILAGLLAKAGKET